MEYITVNGIEYVCQSVRTGIGNISFVMEGQEISGIKEAFKDVTVLEVLGEDKTAYGTYENLSFDSATVYADDSIRVVMHIKSDEEIRLENLEQSQSEQDEMIAELMFGGEQ